jgi:hypothetical protein
MATLEEFRALREDVSAEQQLEMYKLLIKNKQESFQRMVEIAAAKGINISVDEVRSFLIQMEEEEEFDDIELDTVILTAITGGRGGGCLC